MSIKTLPVIVTDLDGTLLDHDSYSFAPAKPALALIAERHYPLILNSSKTRSELLEIQKALGLHQPFICENGAAIFMPDGRNWQCHSFAERREQWLPWIHHLRAKQGYSFAGFSDWTTQDIARLTGLSREQAARAADREFSEPLLWRGDDTSRRAFETAVAEKQLRLVRGGRFYSLQGRFDKGRAMQWLQQHYRQKGPVTIIALGDSPNDSAMLNAADIAVIVKSQQSAALTVEGPKHIIRTSLPGPQGWQQAMTTIIRELDDPVAADTKRS